MIDQEWSFVCGGNTEGQEVFTEHFLRCATEQNLHRGTYLSRQGDKGEFIYLLISGVLENSITLEDGRKKINLLYTGRNLLGLASLDGDVNKCDLRCATKCRVASVRRSVVKFWEPDMLLPMAMSQTYKMQGIYRQLRDQTFLSTEEQIIKVLTDLERSSIFIGEYGLKKIGQQMLADMLGISRVQVSGILNRLHVQKQLTPCLEEILFFANHGEKADE